ncbi:MAG: hypothetical protein ACPGU9_00115 [Flavobacteriaceae bacterium]
MNFNKFYAICCGMTALTIFATYFFVYYDALEKFTATLQYSVIFISVLGFIMSIYVLISQRKVLFSKEYRYTTLILLLISFLAMWYNQYLFVRI